MIYTFDQILLGDMFNTKAARWVKTSTKEAICVMSACFELGIIKKFNPEEEVILLYSTVLRTDLD